MASLKTWVGRRKISMKSLMALLRRIFYYFENISKRNLSFCSVLVALQMFSTSSARKTNVRPTTYEMEENMYFLSLMFFMSLNMRLKT